ncbi:cobalamin-binding protein [Rheinheimera riviphila]|uniref:Cobalamin-binding protein n=1 Tax=Rheinheimera riviphila TaxID=1834037 RepID=A0A437QRV4_9GAMM|nr:cobalamin-binding protein [Rheinheimera riviphila]RVU37217.1 cobalamin-binding protein [Rheinheimera riviphila]
MAIAILLVAGLLTAEPLAAEPVTPAAAETAAPKRLVVLAPNLVELIFSLGGGAQIIATTDHADYPAAARSIPRVGNYAAIQLEKVVALQPDLVLVWDTGTPAADIKKMQQLGLKVLHFQTSKLEDIANQLQQLGDLVQQPAKAQQLSAAFLQQLNVLKSQYQTQAPVRVFYELWDNPLSTISRDAWPQQHLNVCGATNIFEKASAAYPQVGLEQVIAANPALIIQPISENEPRTLVSWQRWPELQATKYKQIIQPDSDLLHRATLRTLDGVATLCREIAKSRQFYAQVPAASGR